MTDIYTLESLPTSWDDNLDWSVKTKVDSRHFAAILQAIFERKTFCKGYVCPYITDAISAYNAKTFGGLEWLCSTIYNELIDLILGDPFSKTDMGMNFGSLGEGCVCQNFCPPFKQPAYPYNSRSWWYPAEADLPETVSASDFVPNFVSVSPYINSLLSYKASLVRPSPEISPFEDINKTNFKLMRWLQETKSHISSLIRLVTPHIHHGGGGKPSIYYYDVYHGETTEEHNLVYKESFDDLGARLEAHAGGNAYNIQCDYGSTFPSGLLDEKYPYYGYSCANDLPPLKFHNCGDFEVDLSIHVAGTCIERKYDHETDSMIETYPDEFESFGLPFNGYGWNNLGTVKPGQSLTIIPDKFASMDVTSHHFYKAYSSYPGEPYFKSFGISLDAMQLYFYTEDGFRF